MTALEELKVICREDDIPFFTDAQLSYYLEKAEGDIENAAYVCLCIKAEDTTLSVSALTLLTLASTSGDLPQGIAPATAVS